MQQKTDDALIAQVRAGEKQAFGELLERYQDMALRVARGMVEREDVARELVQEAFLAAYLSLHQLREAGNFKRWLYSIVANTCRHYLRTQTGISLSLESLLGGVQPQDLPGVSIDPQDLVEEQEEQQRMLDAINALSAKERAVTLLYYYEQLSIEEIAMLLEISRSAVKSRLFQARKRLRSQFLLQRGEAV